jgi:hypothetical protein
MPFLLFVPRERGGGKRDRKSEREQERDRERGCLCVLFVVCVGFIRFEHWGANSNKRQSRNCSIETTTRDYACDVW